MSESVWSRLMDWARLWVHVDVALKKAYPPIMMGVAVASEGVKINFRASSRLLQQSAVADRAMTRSAARLGMIERTVTIAR